MGQESPELLIAVADHDMKSPGHLSAISSSEKPEPAPPSRLWPETSCSQRLHSLTFSWEASRAIEMPLLQAVLFSSFWAFGLGQTKPKQLEISVTRARDKSAHIRCKVTIEAFGEEMIHWYRQKPDQSIEYLIYVSGTFNSGSLGGKNNKLEASKNLAAFTSTLKVNFLEKEDEAVYYCAFWTRYSSGWGKVFGQGTRLIVTPPDGRLDSDISPKPTIFLPSIAEINLHKAGTYLCLLEKFFPDAIRVHWKEKNGRTILESQQGNTVKTNDTYMKFSWLTVIKKSMDREYECVVTHENNKGGVDQEILFPSIKKVVSDIDSTEMCLKGTLQLQLANTSAYYTYLLLLLKSLVYFVVAAVCLLGRTADCGNAKSS